MTGRAALPAWVAASLAVMVVGAFGPWATVLDTITIHGTDGGRDGWIVVFSAAVAALVLLVYAALHKGWLLVFPLLAGALGIATTVYDITDIHNVASESALGSQAVTTEWGVYVALAGSASLTLVAAVIVIVHRRRRPAAPDAPVPALTT